MFYIKMQVKLRVFLFNYVCYIKASISQSVTPQKLQTFSFFYENDLIFTKGHLGKYPALRAKVCKKVIQISVTARDSQSVVTSSTS